MKTIHELVQTLEEAGIEVSKENARERLNYYSSKSGVEFDFYRFNVKDLDFQIVVPENESTLEEFEIDFADYCDYETFEEQSEEVYNFLTETLKDFPVIILMAW
jgi:hypothetical protein